MQITGFTKTFLIYSIRCNTTNKVYVGSTANLQSRLNVHLSSFKKGTSRCSSVKVLENNNFSVYSHISERQPQNRRIFTMAEGLGITSKYLDSSNPDKSLIELSDVIETTRSTHSPAFIEIDTFRFLEHCGPASDDHLDYRDSNYIDDAKSKDPLALLEHELTREIQNWGNFFLGLRKAIDLEIGQAFDFARNSPYPDPSLENPSAYAEARL